MRQLSFSSWNTKISRLVIGLCFSLILAGCGSDGGREDDAIRYQSYSAQDILNLAEDGNISEALNALYYARDEGLATDEHLFVLAQIYVKIGAGIAAEETIGLIRENGFSESRTVLTLAQSLTLQGQRDEADEVLASGFLPKEDVYTAMIMRGDFALAKRDLESAARFYRAATVAEPNNYLAYSALALLHVQAGNISDAQIMVDKAAELEAEDYIVWYARGIVARYSNQLDDAISFFKQSLELEQENLLARLELIAILMSRDDFDGAQEQIDSIYAGGSLYAAANYYSALMLLKDGKFEEAESMMSLARDFIDGYPQAARIYGLTIYQLGKHEQAIRYLKRSVDAVPNDVPARLAWADSLLKSGQGRQALAALKPFIDQGVSGDAHVMASEAATSIGKTAEARAYMDVALELARSVGTTNQKQWAALRQQAIYKRYFDDDIAGAEALFAEQKAENGPTEELLISEANLMLATGRVDEASKIVDQIYAIKPESAAAANLQGTIFFSQKKYAEAAEAYSQAIERVPGYESAMKNRAISYLNLSQREEALKDLEHLIVVASEDDEVVAMYGRVLLETGQPEAALPHLEKAVATFSDSIFINNRYALALASVDRFDEAIEYGERARTLGAKFPKFSTHINEQLDFWRAAKKAADEEKAAEQAGAQAELNEKLAAEEALEKQLLEQSRAADDMDDEQRKARNELFGSWMADELGLNGAQKAEYVQSIIEADEQEPGNTDIVRKAISDLEAAGKRSTIQAIEMKLAEFAEQVEAGS